MFVSISKLKLHCFMIQPAPKDLVQHGKWNVIFTKNIITLELKRMKKLFAGLKKSRTLYLRFDYHNSKYIFHFFVVLFCC
jgi:hypothetical protein